MQIRQVAERTGLSPRTTRCCEEDGQVVPIARADGRFRLHCDEDVARLEVFRLAAVDRVTALRHRLAVADGFSATLADHLGRLDQTS